MARFRRARTIDEILSLADAEDEDARIKLDPALCLPNIPDDLLKAAERHYSSYAANIRVRPNFSTTARNWFRA